jgi:hypothetical protein
MGRYMILNTCGGRKGGRGKGRVAVKFVPVFFRVKNCYPPTSLDYT